MHTLLSLFLFLLSPAGYTQEAEYCPQAKASGPKISQPPANFPTFYKKYIDSNGIPILASGATCDRSLQVAHEILTGMLSGKAEVRKNLVQNNSVVAVFAKAEKLTDLPEMQDLRGTYTDSGQTRKFDDLCGGGGVIERPTAICERNLIGVEDPYEQKMSLLIHEFGHTVQVAGIDQATQKAVATAYANAQAKNLFPTAEGSPSYLMSDVWEYFAEGTGVWFNAADPTNSYDSPEETGRAHLQQYDGELYGIFAKIYPNTNWTWPKK